MSCKNILDDELKNKQVIFFYKYLDVFVRYKKIGFDMCLVIKYKININFVVYVQLNIKYYCRKFSKGFYFLF